MDLTRAEVVLVGLLRGETGSNFHATIAANAGAWHVILSSPLDPVLVGGGPSFDAAMTAAVASGFDGPGDGETVPAARALRVVGGSDHQSEQSKAA